MAVRSRGGPRRPTRVPSPGSLWAVPLAVARGHPTPAAGCAVSAPRGRIPSVPLSARPSASVPSPSAAPRGRVPWCASLPGPAAAPIRRPCRRRRRRRRRRVPDEGAPPPRCARPSAGRVPGLAPPRAGRRVLAARRPPPRSGAGGRTDAEGARRPSPVWPGPGGMEEGESRAARRPPPRRTTPPPPRASRAVAATRRDPRGPRGWVARSGVLAAGGTGAVGSPGPASALPGPPLLSRLPRLAGVCLSPPPPRHRHARLLVVALASPYLVDPASSICLSQRLSHACLSTHGRYSETANGSLNQLWFLWSLAPLLLG